MKDIHYIMLRAAAQATESEDRVRSALSHFLFDSEIDTIETEGYFGNPITILQARLTGKQCDKLMEYLRSELPESDLDRLKNEMEERTDESCCFNIRLDKQAAYQGIVKLPDNGDTIAAKIKIRAYPAKREIAVEVAKKFF